MCIHFNSFCIFIFNNPLTTTRNQLWPEWHHLSAVGIVQFDYGGAILQDLLVCWRLTEQFVLHVSWGSFHI